MKLPYPSAEEEASGWAVSVNHIEHIRSLAMERFNPGGLPSLEAVEAVLLAAAFDASNHPDPAQELRDAAREHLTSWDEWDVLVTTIGHSEARVEAAGKRMDNAVSNLRRLVGMEEA